VPQVSDTAERQRCLAHKMRNLEAKVPGEMWREIKGAAYAAYQADSPKLAAMAKEDFVAQYEADYPSATKCFLDDFDACVAHLQLPISHRRVTRTTNLLERLFLEERRRTKIIPHAFVERAVLKLLYAALIRASETWSRTRARRIRSSGPTTPGPSISKKATNSTPRLSSYSPKKRTPTASCEQRTLSLGSSGPSGARPPDATAACARRPGRARSGSTEFPHTACRGTSCCPRCSGSC